MERLQPRSLSSGLRLGFAVAVLLGSLVWNVQSAHASGSGPVSCWPADGNTTDIVGGHNGTFVGTTAYTAGSSGAASDKAFNLNGSSYVDIPDATLYPYSDVISVAAWVKPSGTQSNGSEAEYAGIVTKDDDTWRLAMWSPNRLPSFQPNLVYFGVSGGVSPGYHDAVSTTAIADGNWHFVVGVYDGQYTNIYVDGQFQAQTYSGGALPTETSTDVQIGANGGGRIFSGAIDEAQIFHAALTPSDVAALYSASTCPVPVTSSGVLQPINSDGSSIFKLGRTVPVKVQLTGAAAGITNATLTLYVAEVTSSVVGTDMEAVSTSAADSGNTFRYDSTSGQYVFNLSTKSLAQGTWQLRIDLGDGVSHVVTSP
jgi:hypothetical protein